MLNAFLSLLSNWIARQQGSHQVPGSVNCISLTQNHFIPIQLHSCYKCTTHLLVLIVLLPYGMANVQQVNETFALNFIG